MLKKNVVTLCFLLMVFVCGNAVAKQEVKIGVLTDFITEDFKPIFSKLASEIQAVVGNEADVNILQNQILVNNFDAKLAASQYRTLQNNGVDIILAFGPVNNDLITRQKKHSKPTILFGAVNSDLIDIDLTKQASGISNFTYMITPQSYKKDLQDFRSLFPFKKVAVFGFGPWITPKTRTVFEVAFAELESDYQLFEYSSPQEFTRQIKDFDAVYLAEGFGIVSQERAMMGGILIDLKKPSFSSGQELDVERGWFATNQSDNNIERLIRRIALSVEAVINGDDLSERPVYIELNDTITINFNTADKINVPIRFSQIANTNLVGDFTDFLVDESYTLVDAVELSLKNNLALKASSVDVDLAQQNVSSAKTNYRPDVALTGTNTWIDPDLAVLSAGRNPERSTVGSVGVSQLLYSEDASAAVAVQENLLNAERSNYNIDELDVVLNTTRAALNLLRLRNALQSRAENLDITKRNLKVAEQNFETGRSSKADIFRFRSELANNLQALIESVNTYRQGQYALNSILNRPVNSRIDIQDVRGSSDEFEPKEFDFQRLEETLDNPAEREIFELFLIEQAHRLSPELQSLEHRLKAVERDLAQYGWRRYIPTVSASAQLNHVFNRGGVGQPDPNFALDDDYNVGLVFSIPLFNKNSDNVNKVRATKQREQLLLLIDDQSLNIETRVRDAVLEVSSSVANMELSAVSEKAAEQGLELIEAAYANGAVTITELIDAQNTYLQAQLASANAYYDFLERAVAMERSVGMYFFLDRSQEKAGEFVRMYEKFRVQKTN